MIYEQIPPHSNEECCENKKMYSLNPAVQLCAYSCDVVSDSKLLMELFFKNKAAFFPFSLYVVHCGLYKMNAVVCVHILGGT